MNASLPAITRDPSTLQTELTAALSQIVSDNALPWERENTTPYECDGLAAYRQVPLTVVLPDAEAQVVEILCVCHCMGVPVVPRGAGASLSGGAIPTPGRLVLSLAKLKRIIEVDPYTRMAVVQPDVRNLVISEAANSHGLYYAPDPSSQIACTVGGDVSEDSGGMYRLKYGLTVHNVPRVHAVMMGGEVVEFGSGASDMPGFDLLTTVIGSEGILVAVTEVTACLIPKSQLAQVIMASSDDVESGDNTVADVIAAGIIPMGLEMMDKPATAAVEEFVCVDYDLNVATILLCESDGMPEEATEEIARMSEVLHASGATHVQVSQSETERLKSWSDRKNAFPAAGRISPDCYCMDGIIPRKHIGTLLRRIQQTEQKHALRCINAFHAGDSNMHPLILFNGKDQDEWHHAELFGPGILKACVELGGIVTGEHGVGVEELSSMCIQFSTEERDAFLCVKAASDPVRLLNPDKAISTLARCAEYGKLHVRNGLLPHPDLPRF